MEKKEFVFKLQDYICFERNEIENQFRNSVGSLWKKRMYF